MIYYKLYIIKNVYKIFPFDTMLLKRWFELLLLWIKLLLLVAVNTVLWRMISLGKVQSESPKKTVQHIWCFDKLKNKNVIFSEQK